MRGFRIIVVFIGILICCSLLLPGCSSGPTDAKAIQDIKEQLIDRPVYCLNGSLGRLVHSISIVGRQKKDSHIVLQALAKCSDIGMNCTGAGTYAYEATAEYERFGKEWRIAEDGFDNKRKSPTLVTQDEDWSKVSYLVFEMDTTGLASNQIEGQRKAAANAIWQNAEDKLSGNLAFGALGPWCLLISSSGECDEFLNAIRSLHGVPTVFTREERTFYISSWRGIPETARFIWIRLASGPIESQLQHFEMDINQGEGELNSTVLLSTRGLEFIILATASNASDMQRRTTGTFGGTTSEIRMNKQWTLIERRISKS